MNLASVLCRMCSHLGLLEILNKLRRNKRIHCEGYRVIDDLYSATLHSTITRTGYINATALSAGERIVLPATLPGSVGFRDAIPTG